MVAWELIYKTTSYIAEEMGISLKRSAFSPNIRERMDHSCAVANEDGKIVAQAEHIPVHLGSFRVGLEKLLFFIQQNGIAIEEGDIIAVNDPYISGTHLNDIMLLAPVFHHGRLIGYVVNKAHHVDVGGPVPGSINPDAKSIYEEGLIIPPIKLVKKGKIDGEALRFIAENVRTPQSVIADLHAQIAADLVGTVRVKEMIEKYGVENVQNSWEKSIEYSRILSLKQIDSWKKGEASAEDCVELDDRDIAIRANVSISSRGVDIDFSGSSKQVAAPLNAVFGVTFAASSYSVRALLEEDVPTNEGFYSIVNVRAEEGSVLNPRKPAPVSGGNLETSQRIVDTVFKALSYILPEKIPAAGSGTMMNVMLGGYIEGGRSWAYYETIGGGTGARPGKDGVSGVHVNMTNTMNTPIEIAERSYPIIFTEYRIREGSGGKGKYRGGDGIIRAFRVLEPAYLAIIGDRFKRGPYGLWGGGSGKPARVQVVRKSGKIEENGSKFKEMLGEGDEVIIETPGGGGMFSEK
ncbi:hydantoinase B/oxoprolinase family protein [Fervidicoccus fontis]|uniref:N-methyl hydantoinase B (HyuB-2) n=2 Tax=Fervidicoccus fontis TaxID=683846 RepID=H9ZZQ6_FERFK|nr:hydantoinase B/oxoprolinase family protein [Fervidicoccus fontis]AFH42213.1 N-methyl hydantoinase B (hyuB-2) [Fervidicoccus fontis Kam940]MBE9390965.1 hydantoinase B/oxoprolinase family protein [Fervidicoccus fontis]PMB75383.1 MAG: 5-oxoprolinase [Fervidicoccus fontis]PMB76275.1 MAG: 5-oxoprolinase [Fervidicoccus fontis]HEW64249.1 5-oxoprolinase [Fervidicoccus fontis]